MNKLTDTEYIMLIADSLRETYGDTLADGDTDIKMADNVLNALTEYLYFRKNMKGDKEEFKKWKENRTKTED